MQLFPASWAIEITSAYNAISNNGILNSPLSIIQINDNEGRELKQFFSSSEEVADEETPEIEKVHIYKLEPFFFPIRNNDKETGKFISVSANLLLSNSVLGKNIDKVLPILRNSIYVILRRKKPDEFTLQRAKTEEKLKKEIVTASNALLLSGAGTVTDVFFSNFMIK